MVAYDQEMLSRVGHPDRKLMSKAGGLRLQMYAIFDRIMGDANLYGELLEAVFDEMEAQGFGAKELVKIIVGDEDGNVVHGVSRLLAEQRQASYDAGCDATRK